VRKCLLDSSFLVDLLNELAAGKTGAALTWLQRNESARLWITPVTMAEVLEGADDADSVRAYLARFSWQGIHRVHADKVALRQRRSAHRLGENDAWQLAIAEQMDAVLVSHDPTAFQRLGSRYEDYRAVD
jgi:predicted nucleic acid-binding protein